MFVWPKPPFQPCTAMIVDPGFNRFIASALRRPNRIRLSTCNKEQQGVKGQSVSISTEEIECPKSGTHIDLPLMALDPTGLVVPEWITSTVEMDLAGGLLAAGNY